jgi:hypothetical protein
VGFDRVGCPCGQTRCLLRQTLEGTAAVLPGAADHFAGPDLRGTRLIVDVATTMAPSQMKDRPGFLYANAFGKAVRTERREVSVSAVRTFEFFHDFLPCNFLQSDHGSRLACEMATFRSRYRCLRIVVNALATYGNKAPRTHASPRLKD